MATNGFFKEFKQLTGSSFATAITEAKATSQGAIVSLRISFLVEASATVIAVVRVTVSNKDLRVPRVDRQELELALVRSLAGWRVARVFVLSRFV